MKDRLKSKLHSAITSPAGDGIAPVRVSKDLVRRLNRTLGSPLGSAEELEKRRLATERLAELRRSKPVAAAPDAPVQAPVVVYHEGIRNARMFARIEELLASKSIAHTKLNVDGDESTMTFVTKAASCKPDDLPIVFVADACIGGYEALVASDVSGELQKKLFPSS